MTTVACTRYRSDAPRVSIPRQLRADTRGFGLVELLIALMVLNIGIFATIAAFNSGALAIRRASRTSTAGALADKEMERFRSMTYAEIQAEPSSASRAEIGPDGRQYTIETSVQGPLSQTSATPPPTNPAYKDGRPLMVVAVVVKDVQDGNKQLVHEGSTFEQCTQDRTVPACGQGYTG